MRHLQGDRRPRPVLHGRHEWAGGARGFNLDGSEIWVSDWAPDGAVVVLDSATLAEIRRFRGLPTPTGKVNVCNTAHDIY